MTMRMHQHGFDGRQPVIEGGSVGTEMLNATTRGSAVGAAAPSSASFYKKMERCRFQLETLCGKR